MPDHIFPGNISGHTILPNLPASAPLLSYEKECLLRASHFIITNAKPHIWHKPMILSHKKSTFFLI